MILDCEVLSIAFDYFHKYYILSHLLDITGDTRQCILQPL